MRVPPLRAASASRINDDNHRTPNGGGPHTAVAIPAFPVYLFDVDGTLVDSAADICGAIQTVLASTPRHDVDQDFPQALHRLSPHRSVPGFVSGDRRTRRSISWSANTARPILPAGTISQSCIRLVKETMAALPGPQVDSDHQRDADHTHRAGEVRSVAVLRLTCRARTDSRASPLRT